jgi:putative membrane protein
MRHTFALALITALALTPACKKKSSEPAATTTETTGSGSATATATETGSGSAVAETGSAAAPAAGALTDPQIAAIVVAANQVDVDAGNLALKKTKNAEVKKFAQQMVTDHTAVNKQASALAKKLKVKPEQSDTSKSLQQGAKENMANLKKLKGAAFDKAYVDHEVAYHEAVLDAIDKVLIPSAQNAELKGLIEKVRPAFVAHLDHAKMLQETLAKK